MADSLHSALTNSASDGTLHNLHSPGYSAANVAAMNSISTGSAGDLAYVQSSGSYYAYTGTTWMPLNTGITNDGAWTDYSATSTIVGWGSFTAKAVYYKKIGNLIFVTVRIHGASNSTSTSVTLPDNAAAAPAAVENLIYVQDNTGTPVVGLAEIAAGSNVLNFYATVGGGSWTANNTKKVMCQFCYVTA